MPHAYYQLKKSDVAEAARINAGIIKPTYWIWVAIIIVVPTFRRDHLDWDALLIRAAVLVPVVVLGVYLRRRTRRRGGWLSGFLATLWFRRDKVTAAPQSISWSAEGFEAATPLGTTRTAWPAFKRWAERDGLYLLYTTRRRYRILPRRAFLGMDEMNELEAYLTTAGARRVGPPRKRKLSKSEAITAAF